MGISVITKSGAEVVLNGDFKKGLDFVKGIQGRKWNALDKYWQVPMGYQEFVNAAVKAGVHDLKLQEEIDRQAMDADAELFGEENPIIDFEETLKKQYGKDVSVVSPKEIAQIKELWRQGSSGEEIAHAYAKTMEWELLPKMSLATIKALIGKK